MVDTASTEHVDVFHARVTQEPDAGILVVLQHSKYIIEVEWGLRGCSWGSMRCSLTCLYTCLANMPCTYAHWLQGLDAMFWGILFLQGVPEVQRYPKPIFFEGSDQNVVSRWIFSSSKVCRITSSYDWNGTG